MPEADLLLTNCAQVVTPVGAPPFRGARLGAVRVLPEGKVLFKGGKVAAVLTAQEMGDWSSVREVDCHGGTVLPGLVDAHTHPVWAGSRAEELLAKLEGRSYSEILAAGGGIHSTVRATRRAHLGDLVALTTKRLDGALAHGTTTLEGKTGYCLDVEGELKLLRVLARVDAAHPIDVVPTVLGAHAVPDDVPRARFLEEVSDVLTPAAAKEGLARFTDAFVDEGALTTDEGRQVLEAGRDVGLGVRIHADELSCTRAARLGLDLGAASIDHLNRVHPEDLGGLGREGASAATLCPVTPFTSSLPYAPARDLIEAGAAIALGSDMNPNAWSEGMLLTLALAIHRMRLTPAEALTAATANSAWSLNLEDRGRLEPGLAGDAVVLDAPRYEAIGTKVGGLRVRAVVKGGALVHERG